MKRPSFTTLGLALLLLSACCSLLPLLACSQNEYSWGGPVPPAPKNPRPAHVIKKEGSGMNAVGSLEEQTPAVSGSFKGTATLSRDAEKDFTPGETLFVIARSLDGNPTPVAAAKMTVDRFPLAFELTDKDAMDGAKLPDQVDILLRLDKDGDLRTQSPEDLMGGPVKARAGEAFTVLLSKAGK